MSVFPSNNKGLVTVSLLNNGAVLADKCLVAERFLTRLQGLMGKAGLEDGAGMLFPRCSSIHMWFMRFAIDVVFLRSERDPGGKASHRVTSVHKGVKAWRPLPLTDWSATETLELPAGTVERAGVRPGEWVCIS